MTSRRYYYSSFLASRLRLAGLHLTNKVLQMPLKLLKYMLNLCSAVYYQLYAVCSEVRILSVILGTVLLHLCQVTNMRKTHLGLTIFLLNVGKYLNSKNSCLCVFTFGIPGLCRKLIAMCAELCYTIVQCYIWHGLLLLYRYTSDHCRQLCLCFDELYKLGFIHKLRYGSSEYRIRTCTAVGACSTTFYSC